MEKHISFEKNKQKSTETLKLTCQLDVFTTKPKFYIQSCLWNITLFLLYKTPGWLSFNDENFWFTRIPIILALPSSLSVLDLATLYVKLNGFHNLGYKVFCFHLISLEVLFQIAIIANFAMSCHTTDVAAHVVSMADPVMICCSPFKIYDLLWINVFMSFFDKFILSSMFLMLEKITILYFCIMSVFMLTSD